VVAENEWPCFGPVIYNENTHQGVWDRKSPRGWSTARRAVGPLKVLKLHVMTPRRRETFPPVTLGHIRGHGCRNLLVYCQSGWCHHSAVMNADGLPDEIPVRSLCLRMVCTACGLVGADVRPDWSPHTNGRPS